MDNEASEILKTINRRNAAEVSIRNLISHFISILAGVADDFP